MAKITVGEADASKIANANQAYGALTEGFYLAGFSSERAMGRVLALLKGGDWNDVARLRKAIAESDNVVPFPTDSEREKAE